MAYTSDNEYIDSLIKTEQVEDRFTESELTLIREVADNIQNIVKYDLVDVDEILEKHKDWHTMRYVDMARVDLGYLVRELQNIE